MTQKLELWQWTQMEPWLHPPQREVILSKSIALTEEKLFRNLREETAQLKSLALFSILLNTCWLPPHPSRVYISSRLGKQWRNAFRLDNSGSQTETLARTSRERTQNKGKYNHNDESFYFRLTFMKVLNKYWDSDLCLTKIKVNEKFKSIGFDAKNNRLAIVTHDRTIYFVDIPKEQTRYIEEAECRFYWIK